MSSYYYHYDGLGSVANVTSATGISQWTEVYEPFGSIRTETKNASSAPTNFMKFTGEYLDPTGLYHLRAREYDPQSGRFTRLDPAPVATNNPYISAYTYTADRPTVLVDPSGMMFVASNAASAWAQEAASPDDTEDGTRELMGVDASGVPKPKPLTGRRYVLPSWCSSGYRYVDSGIAATVKAICRKFGVRVTSGWSNSSVHAPNSDHRCGAACDFDVASTTTLFRLWRWANAQGYPYLEPYQCSIYSRCPRGVQNSGPHVHISFWRCPR